MKKKLQQIKWFFIYPPKRVLIILAATAVGLTALDRYLFLTYAVIHPILQISSDILAIYSMIVILIWAYWRIQLENLKTSELDEFEIKVYTRHKTSVFLSVSWIINVLFSIYYLYIGLRYQSSWFETMAFFYIILSTSRLMLLRECAAGDIDERAEWKLYASVGFAILFVAIALGLLSRLVVNEHAAMDYSGSLIYVVTIWTLYLVIHAIHGIFSFRKYHSPLLSGVKALSLAATLIGLYSLQASLLNHFNYDPVFQENLNEYSADIMFLGLLVLAMYIILRALMNLARIDDRKVTEEINKKTGPL